MDRNHQWAQIRLAYRHHIYRVLNDISNGVIDEGDLNKLAAFCHTSLALMGKVQEGAWRKAERDAEIRAWEHGEIKEADL